MASSRLPIELVSTSKFSVLSNAPPPAPFTDLTKFIKDGKLQELGDYLAEQHLFDFNDTYQRTDFNAAGRKHADSIELQNRTGYGNSLEWPFERHAFRDCRIRRGSAEYWRPNDNATRLPRLAHFIRHDLPFFESTGKVTIILSKEPNTSGMEHVDHKFTDWVSEFVWLRPGGTKEFYVRDDDTTDRTKRYVSPGPRCIWFDDHHTHCSDPTREEPEYSIRVDGVFTDEWREYLCRVGVFGSLKTPTNGGLCGVLQAQRGPALSASAIAMHKKSTDAAAVACSSKPMSC